MNKRLIFICCLVALLAMLCWQFRFDDETPLSTSGLNGTNVPESEAPTGTPTTKHEPMILPQSAPSDVPPTKMKSELVAGGRQWKFSFADSTLPAEVRQRIGYDLNLVFGHLPKFEIDMLPKVDSMPFPLEMDGRKFDRRVRFEGGENRRPKVLFENDFGLLEQNSDESNLFVSKSVIEVYTKAIRFEKQNQAAYQQLDQLLARMSELRERPVENVRDFFVLADDFKSAEAELAGVTPAGFAEAWGGKHYREASILDVASTAGTPLEKYGSLVATTYAMSAGKMDDLPPLVFHQRRWRFLLQRPP